MAEENRAGSSTPYVEVNCRSSGQIRRFAAGTDAGFAVSLINGKLKRTEPVALHIEAVKYGEEPIAFGPNSILVNLGSGWKLHTVISSVMARTKDTGRRAASTQCPAQAMRQSHNASLRKQKSEKHVASSSQPPPHQAAPSATSLPPLQATPSATAAPLPVASSTPPAAATSLPPHQATPSATAAPLPIASSTPPAAPASVAPAPAPAPPPPPPPPPTTSSLPPIASSPPSPASHAAVVSPPSRAPSPATSSPPPILVASPPPSLAAKSSSDSLEASPPPSPPAASPPPSSDSSDSSSDSSKEEHDTEDQDGDSEEFGDEENANNVGDVLGDDVDEDDEIDDPQDQSLLQSYPDHVARQIWQGNERGVLTRATSRRWNMPRLEELSAQVRDIVQQSGLAPLVGLSYEQVDKRLLSSFTERWFSDTNTFHLPVGEMTITLDDVSSLLHIPVVGKFIRWTKPTQHEGVLLMKNLLGFTEGVALEEARKTRGGSVRFLTLKDQYEAHVAAGRHHFAARCYLLHMVGSTLFLDKSLTYVGCQYVLPLEDLNGIHEYAWGACALAHLYDELADASKASKRQLGGYMTLLQAWIKEHFPNIGCAIPRKDYQEHMPRVLKWEYGVASGHMDYQYRTHLESLSIDQVRWQPYDPDHRPVRQFEEVSLFSGYLRLGDMKVAYLPERVLRQFGYVQTIPPPPRVAPIEWEEIDSEFAAWTMHVLDDGLRGRVVRYHGECSTDYLHWVHQYSHPYLLRGSLRVKNPFITNDQYRDRIRRIRELVHPMQMTGVLDKQAIQQILDLCDKPISEDVPCVVGMRGGRAERGSKAERAGRPERGGRAMRGGMAEREGSRGVRGGIADRGNRAERGGRGELGGRAEKGGKAKRSDGRRVRARHH